MTSRPPTNPHGPLPACPPSPALQVIHPSQVDPVHRAFSMDARALQEARELVRAYDSHQAQGVGAFEWRGRMIDSPTYLQVR